VKDKNEKELYSHNLKGREFSWQLCSGSKDVWNSLDGS